LFLVQILRRREHQPPFVFDFTKALRALQCERGLFQMINVRLVKEINLVRFGFANERPFLVQLALVKLLAGSRVENVTRQFEILDRKVVILDERFPFEIECGHRVGVVARATATTGNLKIEGART